MFPGGAAGAQGGADGSASINISMGSGGAPNLSGLLSQLGATGRPGQGGP